MNGDDVNVVANRQDGDTELWGNWTYESQNAVDALRKLQYVTEVDDSTYPSVPNNREIHRTLLGAVAVGDNQAPSATGANAVWGGGWTQTLNYINGNSFDAGGAITLIKAGWHLFTYSGYISSSGGNLTRVRCMIREGAANYIIIGGADYTFASGAGATRLPYFFRGLINTTASTAYRPAYFITLSAGTALLENTRFQIQPMFFDVG
jgi:hypothetical protein